MSNGGWSRAFDDPIVLPDGSTLRTLRDAGEYVAQLPKATQSPPEWQTAAALLLQAAERGGIAMRKALQAWKPERLEPAGSERRRAT
jgi:hypothetical protein